MKIAVFGGSFNPLHNGHAMLADTVIKDLGYDKVLFVPTCIPPHKRVNADVSPEKRLEMLELFCRTNGYGHFEVEPCEIERGGVSYTVDTIEYLNKKYSNVLEGKLAFIMGDEVAAEFDKWKNPEKISELADLIITHRIKDDSASYPDAEVMANVQNTPIGDYKGDFNVRFDEKSFKYPCTFLKESVLPVSSSDIRKRIIEGRSIKYLVPSEIYRFIMENNLYMQFDNVQSDNAQSDKAEKYSGCKKLNYEAKIEEIRAYTKAHVKKSRYEHSERVAQMCSLLCGHYGLNIEEGYLAGIAHDMCKDMEDDEVTKVAAKDGLPIYDIEKNKPSLLHGRAAAILMKEKFGITDKNILEAVAFHTSGKVDMCDLTKCLFLADKIEPGRPQSTEEYRNRYLTRSLDEMTALVILENYEYVSVKKGYVLYPETLKLVEYYKRFVR